MSMSQCVYGLSKAPQEYIDKLNELGEEEYHNRGYETIMEHSIFGKVMLDYIDYEEEQKFTEHRYYDKTFVEDDVSVIIEVDKIPKDIKYLVVSYG